MTYSTKELSLGTFKDFEKLAVKQGGCWCMYYQRPRPLARGMSTAEWRKVNEKDKRKFVREGKSHAILVYDAEMPVGWCQYGTREELPRIDAGRGYRMLGPVPGDQSLWRITCFFVDRQYRGKGVAKAGLHAALKSIKDKGGGLVEAYPVVSKKMAAVPEWRWFGTPSMFEKEGFEKVAPLGTSLLLMRKKVRGRR
ncbi:MAG: GNAT family N-acetyltransferase [Thaumarchaeota archaeon]|nr:GNAT family N-acetyltransferase [Nitrososphaerota archaeon]